MLWYLKNYKNLLSENYTVFRFSIYVHHFIQQLYHFSKDSVNFSKALYKANSSIYKTMEAFQHKSETQLSHCFTNYCSIISLLLAGSVYKLQFPCICASPPPYKDAKDIQSFSRDWEKQMFINISSSRKKDKIKK